MFDNISLMSVIFRLINTGILAGVFVYLFKNYALDAIKARMAGEQEAFLFLQEQKEQLTRDSKLAVEDLERQKVLSAELTKKVNAWQAECNNELVQREQEKELLVQSLIKKNQEQSDNVAFDSVEQHVLPIVLVRTKEQLQTMFKSEEKGRAYLGHLVRQLKKDKP